MKRNFLLSIACLACNLLAAQSVEYVETENPGSIPSPAPLDSSFTATDSSVRILEYTGPIAEFLAVIPNPVDQEVLFSWMQKADVAVTLSVVDLLGSITITLPLGQKEPGEHSKTFATAALSEGTYFASLHFGTEVFVQRFIVLH